MLQNDAVKQMEVQERKLMDRLRKQNQAKVPTEIIQPPVKDAATNEQPSTSTEDQSAPVDAQEMAKADPVKICLCSGKVAKNELREFSNRRIIVCHLCAELFHGKCGAKVEGMPESKVRSLRFFCFAQWRS